ncbi:hypothetical protein HOY80DRAFT_1005835 [Tuber brumale]|nr:hypothetical protein HOY80DRAFT_1005835 [Tuber brumale]
MPKKKYNFKTQEEMREEEVMEEQDSVLTARENRNVKSPSRQTLWRQKKRMKVEQLSLQKVVETSQEEVSIERKSDTEDEESDLAIQIAQGYKDWPRVAKIGSDRVKLHILTDAIYDLRKYLRSRKCQLKGQDLENHKQVLEFMRFQRLCLKKLTWRKPRMELAGLIVAASERGRRVALHILKNERKWIALRDITVRKKRLQGSIISCLEDEETQLAIRQFIVGAGDFVSAFLLSRAITTFWQTGKLPNLEDDS